MSKTAQRRHQHYRHMRRRLSTPLWAWAVNDPVMRNRAARQSVPCSCAMCKSNAQFRREVWMRRHAPAVPKPWEVNE